MNAQRLRRAAFLLGIASGSSVLARAMHNTERTVLLILLPCTVFLGVTGATRAQEPAEPPFTLKQVEASEDEVFAHPERELKREPMTVRDYICGQSDDGPRHYLAQARLDGELSALLEA